jgi:hypothetical protein
MIVSHKKAQDKSKEFKNQSQANRLYRFVASPRLAVENRECLFPAVVTSQVVRRLAQLFRVGVGQVNPIDDADHRGFD